MDKSKEINQIIANAREFQRKLTQWQKEIAPCPWCQQTPHIGFTTSNSLYVFYVYCHCGANGPHITSKATVEEAYAYIKGAKSTNINQAKHEAIKIWEHIATNIIPKGDK